MKEGSWAGGGMTGSWAWVEEINYELEMDIELIVSGLGDRETTASESV